jgi:hypothetical protein
VAAVNGDEQSGFLVPSGFGDQLAAYFDENFPAAMKWFDEQAPDGESREAGAEPLIAHKLVSYIEVPNELLMDYGVIPDTRPKPPPPSWRTRFRRKREQWREQTARRAFKIIAGYWRDDGEDDW